MRSKRLAPLFQGMPRLLRIPIGDGQAAAWLRELLQAGVRESMSARPGSDSTLAKLAELLFCRSIAPLRADLPPGGTGWLAGCAIRTSAVLSL